MRDYNFHCVAVLQGFFSSISSTSVVLDDDYKWITVVERLHTSTYAHVYLFEISVN